jgi:hypothetical protein
MYRQAENTQTNIPSWITAKDARFLHSATIMFLNEEIPAKQREKQ